MAVWSQQREFGSIEEFLSQFWLSYGKQCDAWAVRCRDPDVSHLGSIVFFFFFSFLLHGHLPHLTWGKQGKQCQISHRAQNVKESLHKQLLYPRHPGPSTVGRTGSPRGPTGSSRASVAAARLLDESATRIHCRVAGAPLPRLLQRTITNTSVRNWFRFPISSYFLSLTHLHLKDWS